MRFPALAAHFFALVSAVGASNGPRRLPRLPRNRHNTTRHSFLRGLQGNPDVVAGETAEAEVMIDINPTNPLNLVICGHQPSFNNLGTWYSQDGGDTWDATPIGDATDGLSSSFRFDPWCLFDSNGWVYVAYGAEEFVDPLWETAVMVCRSKDGGISYTYCAELARGPRWGSLKGHDRWSMAVGPSPPPSPKEIIYVAWTMNDPSTRQAIVVSRSDNLGGTWSTTPVKVNDGMSDGNLVAVPSVGPDGTLFVTWEQVNTGEIMFDKSPDKGITFSTADRVIAQGSVGFKTAIPPQPDRGVFVGPYMDVDRSGGAFDGRLYLIHADNPPDDIDIVTQWSSDDGATWSTPITVNDDGGSTSQFLPFIDVDQTTGLVGAVWYDARNDAVDNVDVEVFLSISNDGGVTWQPNIRLSDNASTEGATINNFLEYIGLAGFDGCFHAVWTDNSENIFDNDYMTDHVCFKVQANAGPDQNVECTSAVTLDGSGSTDASGTPLTYTWREGGSIIGVGPVVSYPAFDVGVHDIDLTVERIGLLGSAVDTVEITVEDTTPPVINLAGSDPMTLECVVDGVRWSFNYEEPGYTVIDLCDPDPHVMIMDNIDQRTSGTYEVTYVGVDASGNAVQVSREVVVDSSLCVFTYDCTLPRWYRRAARSRCRNAARSTGGTCRCA